MPTAEFCVCAAGLPIGVGPCRYCKATDSETCGLMDHLSKVEIKENIEAAKAGHDPVHF